MNHDPTRKAFMLKLLGLTAAVSFLARRFGRLTPQAPASAHILPKPEPRAVARRDNVA